MLDLLQDVRFSVRLVNLHRLGSLIDGGGVVVDAEFLPGQGQDVDLTCLGFHPQVIISRVVPSAPVQAGNRFPGPVGGQRRILLKITVKVGKAGRSHPCVIMMAQSVPDPVFFLHPHVTHLNREEILKHRLPDAPVINIPADPEQV